MKKRLLSLLLVLAVVFSFSLSAFATDTGIDIIDDPLSYYFENQMLGVQKGTGVTLVCPKCDYKVVYTGGTLVTCPYDGEACDVVTVILEDVVQRTSAYRVAVLVAKYHLYHVALLIRKNTARVECVAPERETTNGNIVTNGHVDYLQMPV